MLLTPLTTSTNDIDNNGLNYKINGFLDCQLYTISKKLLPKQIEVCEKWLQIESTKKKLKNELEAKNKAYTCTWAYILKILQVGLSQQLKIIIALSNLKAEVYNRLNSTYVALANNLYPMSLSLGLCLENKREIL